MSLDAFWTCFRPTRPGSACLAGILVIILAAPVAATPGPSRAAHLRIDVRSYEKPVVDGTFRVEFRISSPQGGPFGLAPAVAFQKDESCLQDAAFVQGGDAPPELAPGDSYKGAFEVTYAPGQRPYSYTCFRLGVRGKESPRLLTYEHVFVYFTPYDTVEVWSADDFDALTRVWSSPTEHSARRRAVRRELVPVSDLTESELESSSTPIALESVAGLAYSVPRRSDPLDVPRLEAAGAAGTPAFAIQEARVDLQAGAAGGGGGANLHAAAAQGGGGAAPRKSSNRFKGHVVGSVFATVDTDFSDTTAQIDIVDIQVDLMLKKSLGDQVLGTDFTGEGGEFDISFDVTRNDPTIDVYLRVTAENKQGTIRVRKRLGGARSQTLFKDAPVSLSPGTSDYWDFTAVELDTSDLKPQLLHWANRARQFVEAELTGFSLPTARSQPLDIMRSFVGSGTAYTLPKVSIGAGNLIVLVAALLQAPLAAIPAAFISNNDGIYVGSERELDEDVVYHEFGHYLMWHMQGKAWLDPFKAGFATHYLEVNDPHAELAWTEGFASGFGAIVDAVFQSDDGEFSHDGAAHFEDRTEQVDSTTCVPMEDIDWTVNCRAGHTADCGVGDQALTHGFFSEWNVAATIWDLWDGPTQPGSGAPTRCDADTTFEDNGADEVTLTFQEIVQPILDNPGQGLVGFIGQGPYLLDNVMDYFTYLRDNPPASLASLPLAKAQRTIKDIFVLNGIHNLSEAVLQDGLERIAQEADLPNTDLLGYTREVTVDAFKVTDFGTLDVKSTTKETGEFEVDIPILLKSKDDFNVANIGSNVMELSDDLIVMSTEDKGAATLFFDHPTEFGWQWAGNTYDQPKGVLLPLGNSLEVHLAGGMKLSVLDGGIVNLGHQSGSHTASVHLDEGGTFYLGSGKLTVNPGSHLIIERGAKLIIGPGAEIELRDSTSSLDIHGDFEILPLSQFAYSGDGWVNFDLPDQGGLPNVTVGLLSSMRFFENNFTIAAHTYVKPMENSATKIEMYYTLGLLGAESYFDVSRSALIAEYTRIAGGHSGLILNGFSNSIAHCTFVGGNPSIRGVHQSVNAINVSDSTFELGAVAILSEGLPISVTTSTISNFVTGIDVTDSSFGLTDSSITTCTTGVRSTRGGGSFDTAVVRNCGIGWHATELAGSSTVNGSDFRNNALFGALIDADEPADVAVELTKFVDGGLGVSVAGPVTFSGKCVYVARNATTGLLVARGAVLDIANGAGCRIVSNPISVTFVAAAMPLLANGDNEFTPSAGGFTLKGTIDADCVASPQIQAPRNNGTANTPLGWSQYDLTSVGGACAFQLVSTTTALATTCP